MPELRARFKTADQRILAYGQSGNVDVWAV